MELPPTPERRDIYGMVAGWPRRLRRRVLAIKARALRTETWAGHRSVAGDYDGFIEVLGIVYDAEIERQETGADRLSEYMRYLGESVAWGDEVYELIEELYLASTDIDPGDRAAFFAWLARLVYGEADVADSRPRYAPSDDRPPGGLLRAQPLLAHAPPAGFAAPPSAGVLVAA